MADKPRITIQDLYPDLTPEQQAEAEYNLKRYVTIVRRIEERKNDWPLTPLPPEEYFE